MSTELYQETSTVHYADGEAPLTVKALDRGDWHERLSGADRIDRNFITAELAPAFPDDEDARDDHITLHSAADSRRFIENLARAHRAAYGEAFLGFYEDHEEALQQGSHPYLRPIPTPQVGEVTVHVNINTEALEETLLDIELAVAQLRAELDLLGI